MEVGARSSRFRSLSRDGDIAGRRELRRKIHRCPAASRISDVTWKKPFPAIACPTTFLRYRGSSSRQGKTGVLQGFVLGIQPRRGRRKTVDLSGSIATERRLYPRIAVSRRHPSGEPVGG